MKLTKTNITINNNDRLLNGFLKTCEAVGKTMGSEGGYGIYESEMASLPIVTKDGISVAKNLYFEDMHESMGNFMAKQSALRTVLEVGDSTTTSLVLARAFVLNSLSKPWWSFSKPRYSKKVERGFEIALKEIKEHLKNLSSKTNYEDIRRIATISANNNKEIGDIIMKAYKEVGKDGIVDFAEHEGLKTELEITRGFSFDKGFVSPWMQNKANGNWEATNVAVISYEGFEIGHNKTILEYLNNHHDKKTPLLIIAERFEDEDFTRMVVNANQTGYNVCVVTAPFFDTDREMVLEDIAVYTGGAVFKQGIKEEVVLGKASKVIVTHNSCTIINDKVSEEVESRIKDLEKQPKSKYLSKRIQMLGSITCTIKVGAVTDAERKETYDRVEDAVKAVKAALEEGWVAGGGSTLLYISRKMKTKLQNKEEQRGYDIVKKSIQQPFLQICDNAGVDGESYIDLCTTYGKGYNAFTDQISNLIEDGVIDSVKSLRVALENSISVAKLMVNIKVVASHPVKKY